MGKLVSKLINTSQFKKLNDNIDHYR